MMKSGYLYVGVLAISLPSILLCMETQQNAPVVVQAAAPAPKTDKVVSDRVAIQDKPTYAEVIASITNRITIRNACLAMAHGGATYFLYQGFRPHGPGEGPTGWQGFKAAFLLVVCAHLLSPSPLVMHKNSQN